MADRKISDLTALTTPATGDLIPIVDISEAAAADKNKSITVGELLRGAPDGTAAAPGFAFESDGGNGMFLGGTDILAFSTGGTQAVTIDASQRVGLGTSSPDSKFHVFAADSSGSSHASAQVTIENSAASALQFLAGTTSYSEIRFGDSGDNGAGSIIYNHSDNALTFGTNNGTEKVRIDSSGRVGIGTTSPNGTLSVAESGNGAKVTLQNTSSVRLNYIGLGSDDDIIDIAADENSQGTNSAITLRVDGSERARIDSSGRLLVGTSTSSGSGATFKTEIRGRGNLAGQGAYLGLSRDGAGGSGNMLGLIAFADNTGEWGAQIDCYGDGAWTPGSSHPGRLAFSTTADGASSPTERMRIQQNGRILLGTTADFGGGGITFLPQYSNGAAALYWDRANTTTQSTVLAFRNNSSQVGSIYYTNTATTYATTSDYRLKENVAAISDGIDRLKQLKPSRFNFIVDPDKIVDGFLAHEVQGIVPEAIGGTKDEVDDEGSPVYQNIDQSKLVPLLTAALQEAIAKIETLEQRLSDAGIA